MSDSILPTQHVLEKKSIHINLSVTLSTTLAGESIATCPSLQQTILTVSL